MTATAREAVATAAARIVTMLHEVEAGRRPARLLCPLFAAHLRGAIRRTPSRPGPVAGLHRLAVASSVDDAFEIVAVSRRGDRFDALGMRLARADGGGWVVTDVAHPTIRPGSLRPLSDPTCRSASVAMARR